MEKPLFAFAVTTPQVALRKTHRRLRAGVGAIPAAGSRRDQAAMVRCRRIFGVRSREVTGAAAVFRLAQFFVQVTSDQIFGTFTFSIEIGCSSAWARNPGRSRSDLKPMCTVNGEMARSRRERIGLALRK